MSRRGLDRVVAGRLGFGLAEPGTPSPGRWSREARATAFFYLFFVGPTVALLTLLAPGGEGRNETGVVIAIVGAYGVAVALIVAYARLPVWFFHVVLASASALVSVAFYYAGESRPAFALFYVWVALYAGLFFPPWPAGLQIGIAAAGVGTAYAFDPSPLGFEYALLFLPLLATPVGVVLFLMHRQQRVVAALEKSEERLRQAQKLESIGRLAGGVAHDFNNLLTVILGYARILERRPGGAADHFEAHEIVRAAERAAALTGQLLAFGRRQVLRPTVLDVNEVVRDVEPLLASLIGTQIELRLELDEEAGSVAADLAQIEQVVVNLVTNARDAMPGGGTVTIGTAGADLAAGEITGSPPGQYVLLFVSDRGSGMAPDVLEHLFEPFFTTKELGAGTGLGLASVHGVVSQSGGFLDVASEVGVGTTFRIYLPRLAAPVEAGAPAAASSPLGGLETIVLVEDEESVRALASTVLEDAGYTVLAAADGGEATALVRAQDGRVDLLLTDIVMPDVNGVELAGQLVAEHGPIATLFMSGYATGAMADELVAQGSALMPKPFSPEVLLATVRGLLDSRARGTYAPAGRSESR